MALEIESYNGLSVYYHKNLRGGGQTFGQEYVTLLSSAPPLGRVFEWCSGPAFIGFSLLAHGLCESLCLADVNPKAVAVCQRTIRANGLQNKVSVYLSDNLGRIPASEKWDLVVGNPPHFDTKDKGRDIKSFDPGWKVHERFYSEVGAHLNEDGLILMMENSGTRGHTGSSAELFKPFVEAGGLDLVYDSVVPAWPRFYWMGSMHSRQAWEASAWKPFLTQTTPV